MERVESTEGRGGRAWRWLRRGVVALALLALVAWLAVPVAVRRIGESQGTQALGRALRIGGAHFNPLTLSLRLDDVALAGRRAGAPDTATLAHLELSVGWRSLWKRAPVLTEVLLDAPSLRIARTAPGRFDVDDILARLAQRPAAPAGGEPARFALYNLRIEGGSAVFDDEPVHRSHRLENLQLGVPFLSNLPRDVEIEVAPRLQFVLDGARYDSLGQATPFRSERAGEVQLHTGAIDVVPFLAYWPAALAWHPTQGRVTVDATLSFDAPAAGVPHVSLGGDLGVDDLAIVDAAGRPLLAWRRLAIGLDEVRPLERRIALKRVALDGLDVALDRDARGELNVVRALAVAATPGNAASVTVPATAASAPAGPPWSVMVEAVDLEHAHVAWRDARVAPAVAYGIDDLQLTLADVRWPLPAGAAGAATTAPSGASGAHAAASGASPASSVVQAAATAASAGSRADAVAVHLQGRWIADASAPPASAATSHAAKTAKTAKAARSARAAEPASAPAEGRFVVDGRLGAQRSDVDLTLQDVPLGPLRPYLVPYFLPATDGVLSARAQALWSGSPQDVLPTITVTQLAVDGLRLREAGRAAPAAAWHRATIDGLVVDLAARRVELAGIAFAQPEFWLERDAGGTLNVARWVPGGRDGGHVAVAATPASGASTRRPAGWRTSAAPRSRAAASTGVTRRPPRRWRSTSTRWSSRSRTWAGRRARTRRRR